MSFKFLKILYVQVLIAIAIGILLGYYYPNLAVEMRPLGTAFINLIKMVIAPIIFCTVVTGIAGMGNLKAVGKTGGIALLLFLVMTTLALIIGLIVVNISQPGAGLNIDVSSFGDSDKALVAEYAHKAEAAGFVNFVMNIIPKTMVTAFTSGEILQVLFVAILFAFALHHTGAKGKIVYNLIDSVAQVIFHMINIIMKVAPIGAFGAIAFTIGKEGLGSLVSLGKLIVDFYLTAFLVILVGLGALSRACGFSIIKFIRYIRSELLIVVGTSSSESVLPNMLKKMEKAGCRKSVVDLVIPAGYSFNLIGTAIYLTMAGVFLAQATNAQMSWGDQLILLGIMLIASKGAAAVTGGAFIVLAGTIGSLGTIPPESVAIIFGIDRFMSEARALTNLIGNGVATIVTAKWTGQLDTEQLKKALDNPDG
ncbi:MAG: dicarboxylate/amino acid:cation symporter [Alphaproteobacteria bacterium]|nr:dicarboxylate/amino acid:cation symporter [Alphaproteobacteria bacterium]